MGDGVEVECFYSLRPQAPEQLLITSQVQRQEEALEKDPYWNLDDSLSGF